MDPINILVVEDEKNISDVIVAYLERENYNVFVADNGVAALKSFHEQTIHFIILDLMIPLLSGEEVCKNIRATSNVPIIMLTAKTEEEDKVLIILKDTGIGIPADHLPLLFNRFYRVDESRYGFKVYTAKAVNSLSLCH